ncbi:MAG: CxxC-x17-CxxC domain-containing protein [bacterium]
MGSFNRDNKRSSNGFSRGSSGGNRYGGRDSGGRPAMHRATCSDCGNSCEIPFKPTGSRPVFCSDCFEKQGGGSGRSNSFSQERRQRPRFEDKQMYNAVCAKCGNDCQIPFRPMTSKPIYCNNCFEKGGTGSKDSGEVMDQIKMLNAKMDKLIKILSPNDAVNNIEKPGINKQAKIGKLVKEKKAKTVKKAEPKKVAKKVASKKVAPKKASAKKKK